MGPWMFMPSREQDMRAEEALHKSKMNMIHGIQEHFGVRPEWSLVSTRMRDSKSAAHKHRQKPGPSWGMKRTVTKDPIRRKTVIVWS